MIILEPELIPFLWDGCHNGSGHVSALLWLNFDLAFLLLGLPDFIEG